MTGPCEPSGIHHRKFMTTQWTHVLAARGASEEAKESLKLLCERYYDPVYWFVQSYTRQDQDAQDWTQSFFAKLLEGRSLDAVLQSKGKFRSYLLGAVKHFLSDERAKQHANKRGGGVAHQPIDSVEEFDLAAIDSNAQSLDAHFDRQWAISILQLSLDDLASELDEGQQRRFAFLRPWLGGDPGEHSLDEVGAQLGLSPETLKVTIHRWRKRFREIVKSHIAATLSDPSEVEGELHYLICALTSHP